ncbi:MAG: trans-2,3-dihydro-3-hydroxyanthranilate isomerase [Blastocatellia bacterium]|jgi:trans-2,3-dihydro-3-hydroxyanthranilate isomerase|nr:trans-2,3-dihydro-3-hydroxyanthranilate isomerase [Blastocatellia bacterium]
METFRFLQLDVFTSDALAGNPLAVFPEAEGLSDLEMQKIAREMNLSETVFVFPARDDRALRRLRIFTPMRELPFAGHPIVGTWNALAREGVTPVPPDGTGLVTILQEVGIGILPVDIVFDGGTPSKVIMTQGRFEIRNKLETAREQQQVIEGLGLRLEDLDDSLPMEVVSTGISSLAVPIKSLEALGRCRVNASLLSDAYLSAGAMGVFAFTRETMTGLPAQAHARFFAPDDGIGEDPATGSASGALAGYLVTNEALIVAGKGGDYSFMIEQGDFMGRPSRIFAEVTSSAGHVERVRIGGSSVVVAHGQLIF